MARTSKTKKTANTTNNTSSTTTEVLSDDSKAQLQTFNSTIANALSQTLTKEKFDIAEFKRIVSTELKFDTNYIDPNKKLLSFSKREIAEMSERPERYGKDILRLSRYMYRKSGYYKRLVDYFANMGVLRYTIDTKMYNPKKVSKTALKTNFLRYTAFCDKLNLTNEINKILKTMFIEDVVFAYKIDNGINYTYYYLDPSICEISSIVDGNVFEFVLLKNKISETKKSNLPVPLQDLLNDPKYDKVTKIPVPFENSLCLKYNSDNIVPFPPFFTMIPDILLIDEYKDLTKAQSINDAYKLLTMKIPTKDGEITLDDTLITTFTSIVLNTVQNNIGVITTPFETDTEEFSSSNADDRDTVSDAISWAFKNVGVSEALMSGASSGSELKYSIINDSGDIFRIYRMIEDWVKLQTNLIAMQGNGNNFITDNYRFSYKILDMTIFNQTDFIDNELKMAQNGIPNKMRLCSANGMPPVEMLGNSFIENELFNDVFDNWQVLKTSYTQPSDSSENNGGRPAMDETEISEITQNTHDNDGNDPDNRLN